jgi:uncharacterized protein (TIGR02453 family)
MIPPRPPFAGFGPAAATWFERLAADNSREFFQATKVEWQADVHDPLGDLLHEAAEAHPGSTIKLFRPYRDVRFSADKRPIKDTASGYVMLPSPFGLFYASLSAAGLFCARGMYQPAKDQLTRYREAVADDVHGPALEDAVAAARAHGLELGGEMLATAPRGYPRDHPRIELLRMKSLTASRTLPWGPQLRDRRALEFARAT